MNENLEQLAPPVRLEPCAAFRPDPDCPWCSCLSCGWSEDDHPDAVNGLVSRYHDESATGGRRHRLVVAAHPIEQSPDSESSRQPGKEAS